jgi:hypothetical protein
MWPGVAGCGWATVVVGSQLGSQLGYPATRRILPGSCPSEAAAPSVTRWRTDPCISWNRFAGDKRYLSEFPGLGESASEWIVRRQVKTFGVDSPTPDNPASTSYPVHMMCRREHITHYENLAHLDEVVNTRFIFAGFPLKLRGAHGGPTRAVALVG